MATPGFIHDDKIGLVRVASAYHQGRDLHLVTVPALSLPDTSPTSL